MNSHDALPPLQFSRDVVVTNPLGLHARPAAALVKIANQFHSDVWIERDGTRANAKSIMGVLMLAAPSGTALHVIAEGDDAEAAVNALATFFAAHEGP